jgi:hypothetical protein
MALEETGESADGVTDHQDAQARETVESEKEFDAEWIPPAVLFLAAKGVRAFDDEGVWSWVAMGFGLLGAAVSASVIVRAVRRRAYGTLSTVAVGVLVVAVLAHADLF